MRTKEMAKFSLEDGEGSGVPRPKRQRLSSPPSPPSPVEEIIGEDEESDEESEEEEDDDTSDESEEEINDDEGVEARRAALMRRSLRVLVEDPRPPPPPQPPQQQPPSRQLENNQVATVGQRLPQPRLFEAPIFLRHPSWEPSRNGSITVTLSDPEVLDCPICCETLTIPVFQCENGHTACDSCSKKLQHKCPSCAMPIGYNRCRAIENVLESLKMRCPNWGYGCRENISFSKKYEHDKSCTHAPCTCPMSSCSFQGSSKELYVHCRSKHPGELRSFQFNTRFSLFFTAQDKFRVLQEEKEGVVFILTNRSDFLGNVITVSSMGPSSSKQAYFYELTVKSDESNIRFQSFTRNIQTRVEHPPSVGFLLVPNDFLGTHGGITLDVCIQHPDSYPVRSSVQGGSINVSNKKEPSCGL